MPGNKEKMYRHAPLVLPAAALSLFLLTYLTDQYDGHGLSLIWLPWVIFQVCTNTACGLLLRKLYRDATTDTLTGLNNRKYFYEKILELWGKKTVSLLLLDIDNFKTINDTYGHLAGDEALRQLAGILKSNTRKHDVIARWGGEEFALLLPAAGEEEAGRVAERIRRAVENHCFVWGSETFKLTVSVGFAVAREGGDPEQFLKPADEALSRAKEKKNCVISLSGV